MGYVKVNVQISNSGDIELWRRGRLPFEQVRRREVPVVVDTGAINLCLAEEHVEALGLNQLRRQKARLADNSELDLAIVGPVDVAYGDRETTVRALTPAARFRESARSDSARGHGPASRPGGRHARTQRPEAYAAQHPFPPLLNHLSNPPRPQ